MRADRQELYACRLIKVSEPAGYRLRSGTLIRSHMPPSRCTPSTAILTQQLGLPLRQRDADAAGHVGIDDDDLSSTQRAALRRLQHLARQLVPQDARILQVRMAALEDVEIRAAISDAADATRDFVRTPPGLRSRFEGQFPWLAAYHCFHDAIRVSIRAKPFLERAERAIGAGHALNGEDVCARGSTSCLTRSGVANPPIAGLGAGLSPLLQVVEIDHKRDEQALKHHFPERINVEQYGRVAHGGEEHGADDSAKHRAPASE